MSNHVGHQDKYKLGLSHTGTYAILQLNHILTIIGLFFLHRKSYTVFRWKAHIFIQIYLITNTVELAAAYLPNGVKYLKIIVNIIFIFL